MKWLRFLLALAAFGIWGLGGSMVATPLFAGNDDCGGSSGSCSCGAANSSCECTSGGGSCTASCVGGGSTTCTARV
jgi:hypothetical protein